MPVVRASGSKARATSGHQRLRQPLAGFNARLLTLSNLRFARVRAARPLKPRLAFAGVLQALFSRIAARTTRGRDSAIRTSARRPVAPKTAGRESSLSAININWPQSHADRDARQSDRTPAAAGCSSPQGPGKNRQPQQPPWAAPATSPTRGACPSCNSRGLDGRTRATPRENNKMSCSRGTKKPIRDIRERVMSKLIANGCKKKRRKRTYFPFAPSDLDLLSRRKTETRSQSLSREEDNDGARAGAVMGRLNLSSTVSLKPPVVPPGPGAYETHLINPGLDLDKPVSFPQTGRKSMALDNDVPGPGAYPGLFERPYTPGGRMGPVPNLSRVPRVDGDDGVEPGPGGILLDCREHRAASSCRVLETRSSCSGTPTNLGRATTRRRGPWIMWKLPIEP